MIAAASIATLAGCNSNTVLKSGIDLGNLDTTAVAGNDFYQYACGGWMEKNPLPAAYSRYGSFDALSEENNKRVNGILDELLKGSFEEGTVEKKLSDLYKLAMDSAKREQDGVAPAMEIINRMEAAKTVEDLFAIQLEMAAYGNNEFLSTYLGADEKDAKNNILNINQGGLALGQKDYYLENDPATANIREEYKKHIVRMFKLFGFDEQAATAKMNNIMKVETALAKVSRSRTELRDPQRNYNKTTLKEFETQYPHIQLEKLMNAGGLESQYIEQLVVGQPEFLAGADKIIASLTPDEYRDYMEWGQVLSAASLLNDEAEKSNFEFFGKVMSGRKEDHPLWRRSTQQMERVMGEALGQIYVKKYFPAEAKERMVTLVGNLQTALAERIKAQDWMSDSTKQNALDKLSTFYVKVGYPDKWTDISALNIDPEKTFYENMKECHRFWHQWNIEHKAGKPVDHDDWHMYPQTVNAYYNPTTNEICFPAGILQQPFFDLNADDAFNYGAIGVVIGHEMTHGFDDQGAQYDKDGNLRQWWSDEDTKQFTERIQVMREFHDSIEVLPGLHANGSLTLGENMADHGGLMVAFQAFKNATAVNPLPDLDGFTPEQRFFLAYANVWGQNIRDEEIRKRVKSDPHELGKWRVNGQLPHIDAWYEAFGITEQDHMFVPKEKRVTIW